LKKKKRKEKKIPDYNKLLFILTFSKKNKIILKKLMFKFLKNLETKFINLEISHLKKNLKKNLYNICMFCCGFGDLD